jgi:hypothetical protein
MTSDSTIVLSVVQVSQQTIVWRAAGTDLVDEAMDLEPILNATTHAIFEPCNDTSIRTIRLRQRFLPHTPFTEERRDGARDNAYCINLAIAESALWQQNVFQLAHELAHVLAAPIHAPRLLYRHKNVWFEEALAHAAAIHALRSIDSHTARALYPRRPRAFADYADAHIDATVHLVDDHVDNNDNDDDGDDDIVNNNNNNNNDTVDLPILQPHQWYRIHKRQLRDWQHVNENEARTLQCAVSVWLLRRCGWRALAPCVPLINMHADRCTADEFANLSFTSYLQHWLRNCDTEEQRVVVARICGAFGRSRRRRRKV